MGRWAAALGVVLVALTAWVGVASATVVVKLDVEAMTTMAQEVVVGRVEARQSRWEGGRIVTDVGVRVALPIYGSSAQGERLQFQTLGGRVGDLAQVVSGSPSFSVGEEVVLFLARSKADRPLQVVGFSQGRFSLVEGQDGRLWGVQDLGGVELAIPEAQGVGGKAVARLAEGEAEVSQGLPLEVLVKQVVVTLDKLGLPARPEVRERLGADLSVGSYDFRLDLARVRALPAPAQP